MIENTRIVRKLETLHQSTPPFAHTTIKWDMSKLTPIIKKKLLRWLDQGYSERTSYWSQSQVVALYDELDNRFGFAEDKSFFIKEKKILYRREPMQYRTNIYWKHINDDILAEMTQLTQVDQVTSRLEGKDNWYSTHAIQKDSGNLLLYNKQDLKQLNQLKKQWAQSIVISEEHKQAAEFVRQGGSFTFTYNANERY